MNDGACGIHRSENRGWFQRSTFTRQAKLDLKWIIRAISVMITGCRLSQFILALSLEVSTSLDEARIDDPRLARTDFVSCENSATHPNIMSQSSSRSVQDRQTKTSLAGCM